MSQAVLNPVNSYSSGNQSGPFWKGYSRKKFPAKSRLCVLQDFFFASFFLSVMTLHLWLRRVLCISGLANPKVTDFPLMFFFFMCCLPFWFCLVLEFYDICLKTIITIPKIHGALIGNVRRKYNSAGAAKKRYQKRCYVSLQYREPKQRPLVRHVCGN